MSREVPGVTDGNGHVRWVEHDNHHGLSFSIGVGPSAALRLFWKPEIPKGGSVGEERSHRIGIGGNVAVRVRSSARLNLTG